MNYIAEIKAFYDLVQVKQLSTGQIALWFALMNVNNRCAWIEWFTAPNLMLELTTGLSRKGIYLARNVLKQHGIIDFRSNGTRATSYRMISLLKSTQVSTQRKDALQDTTQDTTQGSTQVSSQDTTQGSTQVCATLNKQNETRRDETTTTDHPEQKLADDDAHNFNSKLVKHFALAFGYPPNQLQVEMLQSFLDDGLPGELIIEALKRSAEAGASSPKYTTAILQSWIAKEALTLNDVKVLDTLRRPYRRDGPIVAEDYTYSKPQQDITKFSFLTEKEDSA